jgi:hypothetical protein
VKYAAWNGSGWNFQTAISNADVSFGNIALDIRGYPHFAYYNQTSYQHIDGVLMYASWDGNVWNMQVVDSIYGEWTPGFLSFDTNNPHISYSKDVNHNVVLMYAEWTGTTWSIQTVDSNSDLVMGFNSMALDSSGNPCISYYGEAYKMYIGTVMYARRDPTLSPIEIFGIALLVALLLAVSIYVIVKKRMIKKNEKTKN